jgi:hypothetical protein
MLACAFLAVEAAHRANRSLNGIFLPCSNQRLVVRFAETATEKAARLTRQHTALQSLNFAMSNLGLGTPAGHQALSTPNLSPLANVQHVPLPPVLSTICITGMQIISIRIGLGLRYTPCLSNASNECRSFFTMTYYPIPAAYLQACLPT